MDIWHIHPKAVNDCIYITHTNLIWHFVFKISINWLPTYTTTGFENFMAGHLPKSKWQFSHAYLIIASFLTKNT